MTVTIHPISALLLQWFEQNARPLPWRNSGDPYRVWLSEIILQQTRVQQGLDYYHRFVAAYPDVSALAQATDDEVMLLWQGLGYYSRARHLLDTARIVAHNYDGRFPHTAAELSCLPGIGPYTAAAIASMAFGQDVAAIDGNVMRVLARLYDIDTPVTTAAGKKTVGALAADLLPTGRAGEFNQAMMDFGAMVCTPRLPHCADCPVKDFCTALHRRTVDQRPVKTRHISKKVRFMRYVYIRCGGFVALHRRPAGDIWQGLYEPPVYEGCPVPQFGQHPVVILTGVCHKLTHRVLMADLLLLDAVERPELPSDYIWVAETDLTDYAMPRLLTRMLPHIPPPILM